MLMRADLIVGILVAALALAGPMAGAADLPLRLDTDSVKGYENDVFRLYDGFTAHVVNETGRDFTVTLDVRDLNLFESGPREILFKVYDPDGKAVVREVIPDDGVSGENYLPCLGGWDHEMWYYGQCWTHGSVPMLRWSMWSEPTRLASVPVRTFVRQIAGAKKGIYRVMAVGARDHYVTFKLAPRLKYAVCGHATWLHGHGNQFRKSWLYVPKGVTGLYLGVVEYDPPQTRRFTITAPDGKVLFDGAAAGGFGQADVKFDAPGRYDDQLLRLEVTEGPGDFMLHILLNCPERNPDGRGGRQRGGGGGSAAVLASDPETATAARGGAIYHDGQVFWHMFQVRLHDWLKATKPEDFVVRTADGKEAKPLRAEQYKGRPYIEGLPQRPGFVPLNGVHEPPPLCDGIMHDYPAYKPNPQAINLAIADMHDGLRYIGTGDHRFATGWNGNFGYMFATYSYHYWRPAWRMLHEPDVPQEVKDILREAFLLCGDRLAFGRGIERVNGNAFSHVPIALRYCAAATGDKLQQQLFRTYFDRWVSEGWGRGTGISRSGDSQEHFAHAYHYGTYILANLQAVVTDFNDPEFRKVQEGVRTLYGYVWCPEMPANIWSARTSGDIGRQAPWQGEGGPEMTVSVNGGDEWFAARRAGYYIVTFHGRLAPMWLNNYWNSRLGYGGGAVTQMAVPGKGPVLVSGLNGSYGAGMQPTNWRNFHIHSVVGEMADGLPLITADSDHGTGRLDGVTVSSGGEVRDCPVHSSRRYTFGDDAVEVELKLARTQYLDVMWGMGRPSLVREAYEMIPFIPWKLGADRKMSAPADRTVVTALLPDGTEQAVGDAPAEARAVTIDRGGFGVRIELPEPRRVLLGRNNTVLIELVPAPQGAAPAAPTPADAIALKYRIVPFGAK